MLTQYLIRLRSKHHPFHALKKGRLFSRFVLPVLDIPLDVRLRDMDWPVRVRLMRHLSYVADNRIVEPGVSSLFLAILGCCGPRVFWDVGANFGYYSWLFLSADERNSAVLYEPDSAFLSTSHIERQNLTTRLNTRRFMRKTNGFSKKLGNLKHAAALHFMHYNFVRVHSTLGITPAMAAGLASTAWSLDRVAQMALC